jgi:hypothetical protein
MDEQRPGNYVSFIQDGELRAERVTPELAGALASLGGREKQLREGIAWVLKYTDDASLGRFLGKLRDIGFLFVEAPGGWPPSAVFETLRERGLVQGEFRAVTWSRPGAWQITVR